MIEIQIPDRPGQIKFSHVYGKVPERTKGIHCRHINSMGLFADIKLGEERLCKFIFVSSHAFI